MTVDTETPRKLDGKATAKSIREEVAAGCAAFEQRHGTVPGLTVVLVGEHPASQIYVRSKAKLALQVGMRSDVVRLPDSASQQEILDTVERLNNDASVHGILVQLPLPKGVDDQRVIEAITPAKDVDGFHPDTVGRMTIGLPGLPPLHASGCDRAAQTP